MAVSFVEIVPDGTHGKTTTVIGDDGQTYVLRGAATYRNNNPGAMKYGPRAKRFGAIGQTNPPPGATDDLGYAIFPTREAGMQAYNDLMFNGHASDSIADAIKTYATDELIAAYPNYAADLAAAAGVTVDTKLGDLTPEQQEALRIKQFEIEGAGIKPGTIAMADGSPVPFEVAQQFSAIPLPPMNIPEVGSELDTSPPGSYTVRPGDTLNAIASRAGTTVDQIVAMNPSITDPNRIAAGQTLALSAPSQFQPGMMGRGQPSPVVAPPLTPATPAPEAKTVRATGTGQVYRVGQIVPATDGDHFNVVSDDGHGNAVFTRQRNLGEIPGLVDPMNEPEGTVAGGYVRGLMQQLMGAGSGTAPTTAPPRPSTAQTDMAPMSPPQTSVMDNLRTATDAAGQLAQQSGVSDPLKSIGSSLASAFGPLAASFGMGQRQPDQQPAPAEKNTSGSPDDRDLLDVLKTRAQAKTSVTGQNKSVQQIGQEADNGRMSGYRTIQEMGPSSVGTPVKATVTTPVKAAIVQPTTTYKTVDMEIANPEYEAYIEAQKANGIGSGPGTFADLQNLAAGVPKVAPVPLSMPAKTITVQQKVPVTAPAKTSSGTSGSGGASTKAPASPQYVRKSDGTSLKPVQSTRYNADSNSFEPYTKYVPA